MAKSRVKALLIAEAANPEWTSVPLVGWSLASALRDQVEAHLVTQQRNTNAIKRAGWVEGVDFTSIDTESLARPMWKAANLIRGGNGKGWTTATAIASLTYPYFEHLVWQKFGTDIAAGKYDVVHRITPLTPTANSSLAAKCKNAGVPFVIGPLNGGVPWPKGFDKERRQEKEYLSYIRSAFKWIPGRQSMLEHTAAIIAGSKFTASEIPKAHQNKCFYLPENAIDPSRFNLKASQDCTSPLRGCFIGRLVPYKGPDMLLEAAAPLMKKGKLVLDFIGDGPLADDLKRFASKEKIENAVTFHGWLTHTAVQDVAARANLLTFPSIREFGGGVVLEAMALGVVPIVCDYAGPSELVTEECGYKIPMGSRDQIIHRFSDVLERIVTNPSDLILRADAGRCRALSEFTWSAKASKIQEIYDWVLAR